MLTCLWVWRVVPSLLLKLCLSSPILYSLGRIILRWVYPCASLSHKLRSAPFLHCLGGCVSGNRMWALHPESLFNSLYWTDLWKQLKWCRNKYNIFIGICSTFILGGFEIAVFSGKLSWIIYILPFIHWLPPPDFHSLSFQSITNLIAQKSQHFSIGRGLSFLYLSLLL